MRNKRFGLNKILLTELYWNEYLSLLEIGKKLGMASRTIHVRMLELGIPLRKPGVVGPKIDIKTLKYLYIKKRLSSRKIAKNYKCAYSTIDRRIRTAGLPIQTLAAAHINFRRRTFSGDLEEKAYLIGFRIGDLRVRKQYKNSESISIDCASTHPAQIDLISKLFKKYGRVWISKPNKQNKRQIECRVDLSFSFLLKKYGQFPSWTSKLNRLFLFILAGFIDAEGSFFVNHNQSSACFSLGNYNTRILEQVREKLLKWNFHPRFYMGVKKGYTGKDGYSHREDYWILSIYRKLEVQRFALLILPYLRHREKISDTKKVIENIVKRNKLYGK